VFAASPGLISFRALLPFLLGGAFFGRRRRLDRRPRLGYIHPRFRPPNLTISGRNVTVPIRLQEVALAQIDLAEAAIDSAAAPALDRLVASLKEVGLINPPWLRAQPGRQRFQVVTGTKRVQAAAHLGWQSITVRLAPEDASEIFCLLVHLMDNAYTRGFNLREQAELAVRLLHHGDRETVAARYLPYLGLPPSQAHLARLVKTATLEAPWQQLAAQGRLALTAAARLADWDPADRTAAWPFLEGLNLSQSKQEELLDQVALLARREGLSIAVVLGRDELTRPLTDPDRTPQERTEAVRRQLSARVYPRLNAAREAFETALARLGWKRTPRIRLNPPPAFEGPDFNLEIKFRDALELEQLLAEIQRLTRAEGFDDLTRLSSPSRSAKPGPEA
jgi:ParB family chromosome partitioning protein